MLRLSRRVLAHAVPAVALAAILALPAQAATAKKAPAAAVVKPVRTGLESLEKQVQEFTLANGLRFLVVERDNQNGPDARIKRLYRIDLTGAADGSTLTKTLVRDLMPDLRATRGPVLEKIEGLAVLASGEVLFVTDNDGVNDSSGETQLVRLGRILN